MRVSIPCSPLALLALASSASALQLDLVPLAPLDLSALGHSATGGTVFDPSSGHVWVADAASVGVGTNALYELDASTGAVLSQFTADVVPGLDKGPDAMALDPTTGHLFLFSAFAEDECGEVTQAGALVTDFPTSHGAAAAAFNAAGELYVFSDGLSLLQRLDPTTLAVQTSVSLAYTGRVAAMDFDPASGNLFVYADTGDDLIEVDVATGATLSTTDLSVFGVDGIFPAGMAFDPTGTRLYVGRGADADGDVLHVFERRLPYTSFCAGDGSGFPCACGNLGAVGAGCANSTGAGGTLRGGQSPSVSADDLTLSATELVPGQPALLFAGQNQVNTGLGVPFGDGLRCVGQGVQRLGVQPADASGSATWGPGLVAAGGWTAGDVRYFQGWYRDPSGGPCGTGFNLSNGVEVVFQP